MSHAPATTSRDYTPLIARAREGRALPRDAAMQRACDLVWEAFGLDSPGLSRDGAITRVSWIGFYEKPAGRDEMILLARRDKPACSPLGMHGMCGRCFTAQRPFLVHDATKAAGGYIACDPKDKAEAVVPLFNEDGSCWGVFDADSYEAGAFDEADIAGMTLLCAALGLSAARPAADIARL